MAGFPEEREEGIGRLMSGVKPKKEGASPSGKKRKNKKGGHLWYILGVASLVFFAGIIYLSFKKTGHRAPEKVTVLPEHREKRKISDQPERPISVLRPKIAIMIDDLGNSKKVDNAVLSINAPLTIAILPLLNESRRTAERASSIGKEVLLHLPMEPQDYPAANPGRGLSSPAWTT